MANYTTLWAKAAEWHISVFTVMRLCADGKVPGAVKADRNQSSSTGVWLIPLDAKYPGESHD